MPIIGRELMNLKNIIKQWCQENTVLEQQVVNSFLDFLKKNTQSSHEQSVYASDTSVGLEPKKE